MVPAGSFSLELWFILIDSASLISGNSHPLIALSFLTVCPASVYWLIHPGSTHRSATLAGSVSQLRGRETPGAPSDWLSAPDAGELSQAWTTFLRCSILSMRVWIRLFQFKSLFITVLLWYIIYVIRYCSCIYSCSEALIFKVWPFKMVLKNN